MKQFFIELIFAMAIVWAAVFAASANGLIVEQTTVLHLLAK